MAGDSLAWERTFDGYPASAWTLAYYLTNGELKISVAGSLITASGDDFSIAVPAAETQNWKPGKYDWFALVTKDAERKQVARGRLEVVPNVATEDNYDARSLARQQYDSICAYLADPGNIAVASYAIGGRQLQRYALADLLQLKNTLAHAVASEEGSAPDFYAATFSRPA